MDNRQEGAFRERCECTALGEAASGLWPGGVETAVKGEE